MVIEAQSGRKAAPGQLSVSEAASQFAALTKTFNRTSHQGRDSLPGRRIVVGVSSRKAGNVGRKNEVDLEAIKAL